MKKLYTTIVIALLSINTFAQAPNWEWAKSAGGYDDDFLNASTTDIYGNVYVTGQFISPEMYIGTASLTNTNYPDNSAMYVIKYDDYGNLVWAKSAGGNYLATAVGNSVAVDTLGNVIVTGYFRDTALVFGTVTLTSIGTGIFIVKYDSNGNVIWAKSPLGTVSSNYDAGNSVVTDASGNIYITGIFYSYSVVFGADTIYNTGVSNIFTVKYDTNGNVIWVKKAGGTNFDFSNSVSVDAQNNVYITGYFTSSSLVFGSTTLINTGNFDMFIFKYDTNGNPLWAKSAVGDSAIYGNSIKTDINGNVYVTGNFHSPSVTFGSITLTNPSNGMFLVKYDSLGNVLWAKSGAGTGYGKSVTTDNWGYVYAAGNFFSTTMIFGSTTLTGTGNSDAYIVKYSPTGAESWAKSILNLNGNSISTNSYGNSYLAGDFWLA